MYVDMYDIVKNVEVTNAYRINEELKLKKESVRIRFGNETTIVISKREYAYMIKFFVIIHLTRRMCQNIKSNPIGGCYLRYCKKVFGNSLYQQVTLDRAHDGQMLYKLPMSSVEDIYNYHTRDFLFHWRAHVESSIHHIRTYPSMHTSLREDGNTCGSLQLQCKGVILRQLLKSQKSITGGIKQLTNILPQTILTQLQQQ